MPAKSPYDDIEIPNVDIWTFLFERKDKEYPDDKGAISLISRLYLYCNMLCKIVVHTELLTFKLHSHLPRSRYQTIIYIRTNPRRSSRVWKRSSLNMGMEERRCPCTLHTKLHRHTNRNMGNTMGRRNHLPREPSLHSRRINLSTQRLRRERPGNTKAIPEDRKRSM
jgi:hypothetical protein